jgi:predicted Zn-dependent protease
MRVPIAIALLLLATGCGTLTVSEEEQLGNESARELSRELDFVTDPYVVGYVSSIGEQIAVAAGPLPYRFRFHVVKDDSLNAFALPAGHIYVNTGLLLEVANVSELAGVLAHEVGHVVERHVAQNYRRQRNTGIATQLGGAVAGVFLGGAAARGSQMLGELAAVSWLNTFTREAEAEADAFAVEVLPRAGYHPGGLVSFFETLRQQGGAEPPEFLSSHPATESRIAHTQALLANAQLPPGLIVRDDGVLQLIQRRIRLLARAHR